MAGTRSTPTFEIRPHPDAPDFRSMEDGSRIITELFDTVKSGRFSTANAEIRSYLRQAGLVSLWFFLKVIAGYAGPYDRLNTDLHLDMCNFRQSPACMQPGARAAIFVPRSTFKSTICTHGANSWEIIRDSDIRIRLVNAINAKAVAFRQTSQRTFDSNEFFAWLYPEFVGSRNMRRWSDTDMVVPNRKRYYNEPTIKEGGVGGAAEGDHHDLLNLDDLIGLEDLDSQKQAAAGMEHSKNWYRTNATALLVSPKRSRIILVATRYAIDDVYQLVLDDARKFVGYQDEHFSLRPDGRYIIYYRLALEPNYETGEEEPIFPEELSKEELARIAEDDMWTYMTQYINLPQKTGLAEFYKYDAKLCSVQWSDRLGDWVVQKLGTPNWDEENGYLQLKDMDVVMSVDPAGTEKGIKAKTSRSSVGVWAMDAHENCYRIAERVGYFAVEELFDAIFELHKMFPGYIRMTVIESNAMQKIIVPLLRAQELERNIFINAQPFAASVDKTARIRNVVGLKLSHGKIYLADGCRTNFIEEKDKFPMSSKMDVLDESEKGISALHAPGKSEEIAEDLIREEEAMLEISNTQFGY